MFICHTIFDCTCLCQILSHRHKQTNVQHDNLYILLLQTDERSPDRKLWTWARANWKGSMWRWSELKWLEGQADKIKNKLSSNGTMNSWIHDDCFLFIWLMLFAQSFFLICCWARLGCAPLESVQVRVFALCISMAFLWRKNYFLQGHWNWSIKIFVWGLEITIWRRCV